MNTTWWCSVLHEVRDLIKEREKQKREAMRNLHYLFVLYFKVKKA
nr:hypothetical protein [Bartonella rattaustraliani]